MQVACGKDKTRPEMQCVYFENGYAYATNAHLLVRNRIDQISNLSTDQIMALDGKMIHKKDFAQLSRFDVITVTEEGIEAITEERKAFFYFYESEKGYPDTESIIQSIENASIKEVSVFGINFQETTNAQKALPEPMVKMIFKGANKGVIIRPTNDEYNDCMAIIMPLQINGE